MKNKKLKKLQKILIGFFGLITPLAVNAQRGADGIFERLNKVSSGFWTPRDEDTILGDVANFIGDIINIILSLVGVFFLILIIYAGFMWMFARGNEEDVTKAKKTMISSFQGLIIIVIAYAITNFIGFVIDNFQLLN